jgi:hypothetical protein
MLDDLILLIKDKYTAEDLVQKLNMTIDDILEIPEIVETIDSNLDLFDLELEELGYGDTAS